MALFVAAPAAAATYSAVANAPAVIWVTDVPPTPPPGATIRQTAKTFVPEFVILPIGTSVTFPNDDAFYHSVYSDSPGNAFDLGLYDTGPGKTITFSQPGVVDIHCHVHGTMHATIILVDGPYAQTTQPHERFHIDGIRPGRHVLHEWTGGTNVSAANVLVTEPATVR